jgi:hypothetical protein
MTNDLEFLLSLSILLPLIAGIIRSAVIQRSYYPIIYLIIAGFVTEMASHFSDKNAVIANIYILAEFIIYCWQFYNLKNVLRKKSSLYILIFLFTLLWLIENIVLKKITTFDLYYRIIYSFTLVLLAVNQLNYLIINERENILFNAIFILCSAMIIFYSYKCLVEIFFRYAHNSDTEAYIFSIQAYINVLFNILLTLVVLCLPKKRIITLR